MDAEDAEFDIYEGLDEFASNERNSELENALKTLEQKYEASVKEVECLKDENQKLKAEIKTMNKNFRCLLLTAKAELSRKQATIDELTQKRDDMCFRRKNARNATTEPAPVNNLVISEPTAPVVNDDRLSQSPHLNSNKHDQPRCQKYETRDSTRDAEKQSCDNRVKVNRRDEQNSHDRYSRHDYNRDRDNRKYTGSNPFRSRDRDVDIRHTKRKHEDRHDERDKRRKIERHDVKRRSREEFEHTERSTKRYRDEKRYFDRDKDCLEKCQKVDKGSRKYSVGIEKEQTDSLRPSSIKQEEIPENVKVPVVNPVLDMKNVDNISSDDENFSSVGNNTISPCMSPVEMEGNDHEESSKTEKQNCHDTPEIKNVSKEALLPDTIKQNDSSPCDSTTVSAVPVKATCSMIDCKPLLELSKTPNNENSVTMPVENVLPEVGNVEENKEEVVTSDATITNNQVKGQNDSNKDVKDELLSQENPNENETQYMNFASGLNEPSIERNKLSQRADSPASKKSTSSSISVDTSFHVHEPSNLDEISHILSTQNADPEDVKCQAKISNQKQMEPCEQLPSEDKVLHKNPKDEPLKTSTVEAPESVNRMKHLSVKKIPELCDTQRADEADLNVFLTKKHKASIQGKEASKNSVPDTKEVTPLVKEILKTKSWEPMKPRKYATPTKKEKILSMGNPNYSVSEKVAIPESLKKDIPTVQNKTEDNIANSPKHAKSIAKDVIESPLKSANFHETITAVGNLLRYFDQDGSPKEVPASTKPSLAANSPGNTEPKNESNGLNEEREEHLPTEGKLDEAVVKKIKDTEVRVSPIPEERSKESTTKSRTNDSVVELTTEEMVPANSRIDPTFTIRATEKRSKTSTVSDTKRISNLSEHKLDSVPESSKSVTVHQKRTRGRPRRILATEVLLPDQIDINATKDLRASTRIKKKVDYVDYVVNENSSKKISRTKSPKKSYCGIKNRSKDAGLLVKEDSSDCTASSGKKVAKTENEDTPKEHSENISHVLNLEEHAVFNVFPSNTSKVTCDKDSSKEMNVSDTNREECKNVSIRFEELFGKSPVQDHKHDREEVEPLKMEKDEVKDLLTVLSAEETFSIKPDVSECNKIQEKPVETSCREQDPSSINTSHETISISTSVTDYTIESVTPNIVNVFITRKKIKKKKNLL